MQSRCCPTTRRRTRRATGVRAGAGATVGVEVRAGTGAAAVGAAAPGATPPTKIPEGPISSPTCSAWEPSSLETEEVQEDREEERRKPPVELLQVEEVQPSRHRKAAARIFFFHEPCSNIKGKEIRKITIKNEN